MRCSSLASATSVFTAVSGCMDQPGRLRLDQIARLEPPLPPPDPPGRRRLADLGTRIRGHDVDDGPRLDQSWYATSGHPAPAHDEHPPAFKPQGGGVPGSDGHLSSFSGGGQSSASPGTTFG